MGGKDERLSRDLDRSQHMELSRRPREWRMSAVRVLRESGGCSAVVAQRDVGQGHRGITRVPPPRTAAGGTAAAPRCVSAARTLASVAAGTVARSAAGCSRSVRSKASSVAQCAVGVAEVVAVAVTVAGTRAGVVAAVASAVIPAVVADYSLVVVDCRLVAVAVCSLVVVVAGVD